MLRFTTEQLQRIILAGGGVKLDATNFTVGQLQKFGLCTHKSNKLILLNALSRFTVDQLQQIALSGNGNIFFES